MNEYLKNLNKIEFVITNACTGRCKHCSQGEHPSQKGVCIDPRRACDAVKKIASLYDIKTVMTFGGEPLLYPDVVCAIMKTSKELGVEKRQVITNGFFSKDKNVVENVCKALCENGVNDLLLSVDAFHQETIPLDAVYEFAVSAKKENIPLRLSPAWLVSREHDNEYNKKTRAILERFCDISLPVGEGNVIFPEGNALKYLSEYFTDKGVENPYVEDPSDVRCISFDQMGNTLGGNIYKTDIIKIMEKYKP